MTEDVVEGGQQLVAEPKAVADARIRAFTESRGSLLRALKSPAARLVRQFLRERRAVVVFVSFLDVATALLEALRLVLFVVAMNAIVGEVSASASALNLFGVTVPIPFLSSLPSGRDGVLVAVGLLIGVTLIREGANFAGNVLAYRLQSEFMYDVRKRLLDKLLTLESRYFTETRAGDVMYLQNTIASRFVGLLPAASALLAASLDLLASLVLLAFISGGLTVVLIVLGVAFVSMFARLRARARGLSWDSEQSSRLASTNFLELVQGIRLIKLGGQEGRIRSRYLELAWNMTTTGLRQFTFQGISQSAGQIAGLMLLLVVGFAANTVSGFGINHSVALQLAYVFIAYRALTSIGSIADSRLRLATMAPQLMMVVDFLEDPSYVERASVVQLPRVARVDSSLAADAVSFSYVAGRPVLADVSLDFRRGTSTAVVGASGSGKTTLLELLAGFRDPTEGRIVVDGTDLGSLDTRSYRELVGYVTQETVVFHDTLLENLRFLRPQASTEELEEAVRLAAADDFVAHSEHGYETIVGERGLKISGGQRQRIALARVLLQDAPVLLLDEATNALDLATEARVFDNLLGLKEEKIVVVAAHRLSALTRFDKIVVLHHGRVVEQGSHAELMSAEGLYFHLFGLQQFEPQGEVDRLSRL